MLRDDLERLRNTLLAARQAVRLAGAAGPWLAGYEAALVTVAVAFGLEARVTGLPPNEARELNHHPRLAVRVFDEDDQPAPA